MARVVLSIFAWACFGYVAISFAQLIDPSVSLVPVVDYFYWYPVYGYHHPESYSPYIWILWLVFHSILLSAWWRWK